MIEVLINIEENTYIDAQNLSLVILKELKEIKYKFNQIEKFLNI